MMDMMNMFFKLNVDMKNILFEGLNTNSVKDVALLSVAAFICSIVFSALLAAKAVVAGKRKMNPLTKSQQDFNNSSLESSASQSELLSSLRIPTNVDVVRRHKLRLFVLESFIHTFKFAYGYMLMLLVMKYNVWFTTAVVLGSAAGYFLFNPLTVHISRVYSRPPTSRRECSHEDSDNHQEHVMPPSSVNNGQGEALLAQAF